LRKAKNACQTQAVERFKEGGSTEGGLTPWGKGGKKKNQEQCPPGTRGQKLVFQGVRKKKSMGWENDGLEGLWDPAKFKEKRKTQ